MSSAYDDFTTLYPYLDNEYMYWFVKFGNYYASLVEERAELIAKRKLQPRDEEWFKRKFEEIKKELLRILDCYVQTSNQRSPCYWYRKHLARVMRLSSCHYDHSHQRLLTPELDRWYYKEIYSELREISEYNQLRIEHKVE